MQRTTSSLIPLPSSKTAFCVLAVGLILSSPPAARALNGTWNKNNSGNWSDAANWLGGNIADGAGAVVNGESLSGSPRTITVDGPHTIGSISMNCNGVGRTYIFNDPTGANPITFSGGATPHQVLDLNGQVELHVVLNGTGGVRFVGQNSTPSPGALIPIYLYATNTYSGNTEIAYEGPLRIGGGVVDAIPHGPGKGDVILVNLGSAQHGYGNLDIRESDITINGLSGAGGTVSASISINPGTSTLTLGDGNATATFSGVILDGSRTVALTKIGTGTQTLNGQNSYTGDTTVSAGMLNGSGLISGLVKVGVAGNISAGASAGTLTLQGGLDLSAGGTNVWEIADNTDSDPSKYDQIVMTGGVLNVTNATLVVKLIGLANGGNAFWSSSHIWTIISLSGVASNPSSSIFTRVVNASSAPGNFTTSVDGNGGIVLTFTPGAPLPTRPVITSIVGAGSTSVTVNWTNGVNCSSYVLQYNTNLNNTANWTSLSASAGGTSGSKTDNPPAGTSQRYYRVYGVYP